MSTQSDTYGAQLAAWKAKQGVPSGEAGELDHEALMVAEDAKRKGNAYCMRCAEQFRIAAMRLITRSEDPYRQFDDESEPVEGREWYIKIEHRVRMCVPCYRSDYENLDESDGSENTMITNSRAQK